MKIYCMSDIHGCIAEFEYALSLIDGQMNSPGTRLVLLGDYVHGPDSYAVLDQIISLQNKWGCDKVIALMGNHEDMVCDGRWRIEQDDKDSEAKEDEYIAWMQNLPRYYTEGNTIFVHAGIDDLLEPYDDYDPDYDIVTVTCTSFGMENFAMQYADRMEVLAPPDLRGKIRDKAKAMAERYRD